MYKGKVIVTGGHNGINRRGGNNWLKSTEVIELSSWVSKRAGDLNIQRVAQGMGIVDINGKSKLIVFGGTDGEVDLDSIEEWDEDTETWTMSTMKLSKGKCFFGFCQLP